MARSCIDRLNRYWAVAVVDGLDGPFVTSFFVERNALGFGSPPPFGVLEAIALAFCLEEMASMGETIKGGARGAFAAENFGRVFERQVRGSA